MIARQPTARSADEDIAIIGLGCRFPQAADPTSFWRLILGHQSSLGPVPDRVQLGDFYSPIPGQPGKVVSLRGGFIEDVDLFDTDFFQLSPREAAKMDPQHRLLLLTAWEAMEDAGFDPRALRGAPLGVYVGISSEDWFGRMMEAPACLDAYASAGGVRAVAPGRVSYSLDLRGPSMTIDTACSSSLVALHLAVRALRHGEAPMALVGGANLLYRPEPYIGFSRAGMLAPDGHCKAFDEAGDGFVRSEGVGMALLAPLSTAIAQRRRIYAVIRGTCTNNDGRAGDFLMTPAAHGQLAAIRAAWADAGLDPARLAYLEAHGTGTRAGDPVEIEAISTAAAHASGVDIRVGSVKTNIGHTEAAAGIAGLIKTSLALHHQVLPPNRALSQPSTRIPWSEIPVRVQTAAEPWPAARPLAAISSFGIGGSNAHAVLSLPPAVAARPPRGDAPAVLLLSGHSPAALQAQARNFAAWIKDRATTAAELDDICFSATRRARHSHRLAVIAPGAAEVVEALERAAEGVDLPAVVRGLAPEVAGKVAFVFPGQGSQWVGMGRSLLVSAPAFAGQIAALEPLFVEIAGWSLIDLLEGRGGLLDRVDRIQPAIFAMQVGLAAQYAAWGIQPDAVIGHSMGEVAAAVVAGALDLRDGLRVICVRSQLARDLAPPGAMAVVELPPEALQAALAGFDGRLAVAARNGPTTHIVAGEPAAMDLLGAQLEAAEVFFRRVEVDYASHSPQMDPLLGALRAQLHDLQPRIATLPLRSTVRRRTLAGPEMDAAYWAENLRQPVQLHEVVDGLPADGFAAVIEISPHPVLSASLRATLAGRLPAEAVLPSLRRDEAELPSLLRTAAALACRGLAVDVGALQATGARLCALPPYAWQGRRLSIEDAIGDAAVGVARGEVGHPLLGRPISLSLLPHARAWEGSVAPNQPSWVKDHAVGGAVLFPTTGYIELLLAAGREAWGGCAGLHDLVIHRGLPLTAGPRTVQLCLEPSGRATLSLRDDEAWERLVTATLLPPDRATPRPAAPADPRGPGGVVQDRAQHMAHMAQRGLQYGPTFQGIEQVWRRPGEAVATVALPAQLAWEAGRYIVHPALLDACLQTLVACLPDPAEGQAPVWVPVGFGRLSLWGDLAQVARCQARLAHDAAGQPQSGALRFFDADGRLLGEIADLRMRLLTPAVRAPQGWLHSLAWRPFDLPDAAPSGRWWLVGPPLPGLDAAALGLDPGALRVVAPEAVGAALATAPAPDGILWLPEERDPARSPDALPETLWALVALLQALPEGKRRLVVVTRGACAVLPDDPAPHPDQTALWSLGRVIAQEYAALRCVRIDLLGPPDAASLRPALASSGPDEWAWREGRSWAPKLQPEPVPATPQPAGARPYRLELDGPTPLAALRPRACRRVAPGPREVEIAVEAAGLNFIDVMRAMGLYPDPEPPLRALGMEGAGRVVAVGTAVGRVKVGDTVVFASDTRSAAMGRYALAHEALVWPAPPGLSLAQAAALPIAYLTAGLALQRLGHLEPGERVLIHAASGGVGLAALHLARQAGAEVYATAGSPEKRALVRAAGAHHVYDSRSAAFADDILAQTGGRGVDVVLNSLSGALLEASLRCLAVGGRFVEIGKTDIAQDRRVGLGALATNRAFLQLDLNQRMADAPERLTALGAALLSAVGQGELPPLPVRSVPVERLADAFVEMAQARHTGKLMLEGFGPAVPILPAPPAPIGPGAWLITGGLGGLGLTLAGWLVDQGVQHLALLGRREPNAAAAAQIAAWRQAGVAVDTFAVDVSQGEALDTVFAALDQSGHRLTGVLHAAGLLDDGVLERMDRRRFEAPWLPKVQGAWNLHQRTQGRDLDYFVLFSSAAVVIGSPGQGNYVAANGWLDGLAHLRRHAGLPATTLQWGPWAEVGLAAHPDRGGRLAQRGVGSMAPALGAEAFGLALARGETELAIMDFDPSTWRRTAGPVPVACLEGLLDAGSSAGAAQGLALPAADPDQRRRQIEAWLAGEVGRVLGLRIEDVPLDRPLSRMGLDSLMAVDLKNRIDNALGVVLPVLRLIKGPAIGELAADLAAQEPPPPAAPVPAEISLDEVDGLSEEELDRLLNLHGATL